MKLIFVYLGGAYAFIVKKSLASLMGASMIAGPMVMGGVLIMQGNHFYGHTVSGIIYFSKSKISTDFLTITLLYFQ